MLGKKRKLHLIYAVMFLYPFLPILKEWDSTIGTILEIALLLLIAAGSLISIDGGAVDVRIGKNGLLYILISTIYLFVNCENISYAISGYRCFILYYLIYTYFMKGDSTERYRKSWDATSACVIVAVIMSLGCIVQFVRPDLIQSFHNPSSLPQLRAKTDWMPFSIYNRTLSFMTDPNILSVFLTFAFIIYYYRSKKSIICNENKRKIGDLIIKILLLVGITLTQSRTGIFLVVIFGLTLGVNSLLLKEKLSTTKAFFLIVAIFAAGLFLIKKWDSILAYLRVDTLIQGNGRTLQNEKHVSMLFEDALRLFVGNGLFDGRTIIFENSYLMVAYMFGIIGTLVFLLSVMIAFKEVTSKDSFCILMVFLAACYVGDYILIPQITLPFIAALTLINAEKYKGV